MSDVNTKSVLDLALEEEARKEKEKEEAKQRKAAGTGNFEFEELKIFVLEDKVARVCRLLGAPVQIRQKSTDAKYVLQSEILDDTKKSYAKINWPMVEKDGKLVPDSNWILTKLLNKVREGKWVKYEDGHIDDKGKNGSFVRYHTETTVSKRIEGNSKPKDKYPRSFYPQLRVVINTVDRHDDWCKVNKHSKLLSSKSQKYEGQNDKGEKFEIWFTDTGVPQQCYNSIISHLKACSGVKSLEDIDVVIIRDGKSVTKNFYQCFDKTDYPKYFNDESAFKLTSNEPLTEEEKSYELYDLDKFYAVSTYAKLKKRLIGLFKLCDVELGTSFEQELEKLVAEEAKNKPVNQQEVKEEPEAPVEEEKFDSIAEDSKPVNTTQDARSKRAEETAPKSTDSIQSLCIKNFPHWDDLNADEKLIMINSIESFRGTVPVYKKTISDLPCAEASCKFVGVDEPTAFPAEVKTCPVCGFK